LEIGIDLGLKTLASFYRKSEAPLATAQRARKSKPTRTIHAKVRNRRKNFLHQASAKIARENGLIIVGDCESLEDCQDLDGQEFARRRMGRFQDHALVQVHEEWRDVFEVAEAYSSQACSTCGTLPASRPQGIAGLRIREWACSECGAVHDRDVNAARNILRAGRRALDGGALAAPVRGSSAFRPGSRQRQ
jgi:putative transposase